MVGRTPVLPIPSIPGHPADLVGAYKHLLTSSPTTSSIQSLLTFTYDSGMVTETVRILAQALHVMLPELDLDSTRYSLHSLRRGGATLAYRVGDEQMQIKLHGLWFSDICLDYVTSACVQRSPDVSALAGYLAAT